LDWLLITGQLGSRLGVAAFKIVDAHIAAMVGECQDGGFAGERADKPLNWYHMLEVATKVSKQLPITMGSVTWIEEYTNAIRLFTPQRLDKLWGARFCSSIFQPWLRREPPEFLVELGKIDPRIKAVVADWLSRGLVGTTEDSVATNLLRRSTQ
jgi:hypothetical protein